ncbi:MAG: hypothetical protein LLF94_06235, partial [Chlamydiales bacterium]|nr:hypothetical protein [Chlamydiales bacterium]
DGFAVAKLAHLVPECPIMYDDAAIRGTLANIPPYKPKLDSTLWDAVVGKEFKDPEHNAGLALRGQAYLLSYMPESISSKRLDVELDLLLQSIRKDPTSKFILDFFVRSYENRGLLQSYDLTFRQYRCDALFQEASEVVASILHASNMPYDIYYYAKAWQQGIDFCRQAGQPGVELEQHKALTHFIFSRLEALSKKTGFILLENDERFTCIVQKDETSCTPQMLFRLLATCLFGIDAHEVQAAHMQLTKFLELGDISQIPAPLMTLVYENTAEKILKDNFEVGKREKYLFYGGPATRILTTNTMTLADIKIVHALHSLFMEEKSASMLHPKPITAVLLHSKINLDRFVSWGQNLKQ